jgi:hypothetical protein
MVTAGHMRTVMGSAAFVIDTSGTNRQDQNQSNTINIGRIQ